MNNTYFPQYVHSELEDGKIRLRICVTSDTPSEENYAVMTRFCKRWKDDPNDNYTYMNVDFDIGHIIEDALYINKAKNKKYIFTHDEGKQFLLQLQDELIKALTEVSKAIGESI